MQLHQRLPASIRAVLERILGADGESAQNVRVACANSAARAAGDAQDAAAVPDALRPYVEKVTTTPYKVVARDLDALRGHGFSEDEIFEITIATALGAGTGRYQRVLSLLEETSAGGEHP